MTTIDSCPAAVKVLGKTYSISIVEKVDEENSQLGEQDEVAQKIVIRREQHFESFQDTLLHEVIHAVELAMGLELREEQVNGIATGLIQVLRDNPRFARFLVKRTR